MRRQEYMIYDNDYACEVATGKMAKLYQLGRLHLIFTEKKPNKLVLNLTFANKYKVAGFLNNGSNNAYGIA